VSKRLRESFLRRPDWTIVGKHQRDFARTLHIIVQTFHTFNHLASDV
jgi:hypothetical protein